MGRIGAIALALALAGCGLMKGDRLSAMTPEQLRTVSNKDLCFPYADSRAIDLERQRRRLVCRTDTNDALGPSNPVWGYMIGVGAGMLNQQPAPGSQMITCRPVPGVGNTTQCQSW